MVGVGDLLKTDDGRVYCYVRRTPGDRYRRKPKPGQMLFWRNRKRGLVTTRRGRLFAGLAVASLRANHFGFIQVYGPI